MRAPAARTKPRPRAAQLKTFPAPVSGWIANQNLLVPNARKPDGSMVQGAAVLENWFPTATGVRMRAGSGLYATIGDEGHDVISMFSYVNGNNDKLFATTASAIYNISSPVTPDNVYLVSDGSVSTIDLAFAAGWSGVSPPPVLGAGSDLVDDLGNILIQSLSIAAPDVDLLLSGDWSVVQFATSGGTFLRAVNGTDTPLVYDGTSWALTPAITGVDPTTLSFVWASHNRLFFIQKDTLNVWYLPVSSIGGAAVLFPLGGIFTLGGSLIYGGTWSIESGNGPTEQTIFVTSEGEVATYTGGDPSDATTWSRNGVFRVGKPRGPKAFIRAGGDLVIATDIGLIPLSTAFQRDIAALSQIAVSYAIETEWNKAVAERSSSNWHAALWPTMQMMMVALPTPSGGQPEVFVANARTGAWAPYTGWNATCLQLFGDRMFFGSDSGKIVEAEVTGADQGAAYTSVCVPLFDSLRSPAAKKVGLQSRAVLRAAFEPNPKMSLQEDYTVDLPTPPDDTTVTASNLWGTGIWGTSVWSSAAGKTTFQQWRSTPGAGYSLSPATQITSGNISAPDIELVQTDLTYDVGDVGT